MKVILVAAISVDGKIARESKDRLDWTGKEDKRWFFQVSREAGVVVMGRKTYELMERELKGRLVVVVSRRKRKDVPGRLWFRNGEVKKVLEELKKASYERVIIGGGSGINRLFLEENLIDEIWLSVIPVLWGKGIGLVSEGNFLNKELRFLKTEELTGGGLVLKYEVKKGV